jgi:hypothetical protein
MKKLFGGKSKAAVEAAPEAPASGPIVTPLKPGDLGYPGNPRRRTRARGSRDTILAQTLGG